MMHSTAESLHKDDCANLMLQPPPDDTSTELDPKYKVTYLSDSETAPQAGHEGNQAEAVAAAYAFSQLEASLSGVPTSHDNAEAISRQGMTASTSGTTNPTHKGIMHCRLKAPTTAASNVVLAMPNMHGSSSLKACVAPTLQRQLPAVIDMHSKQHLYPAFLARPRHWIVPSATSILMRTSSNSLVVSQ